MRWWRISSRFTGFAAVTLVLYLLRIVPRPLLALREEIDRSWGRTMFGLWAGSMRRLLGMRIQLHGPLPGRGAFVATNHLGYVDIVLLASLIPAVFVAKSEVAGWPLLGRAVRSVGTIFVDRKRRRDLTTANASIRSAIDRGDTVVLFPEGTSSSGDSVLPMRPSLLEVPATMDLPVSFAAIRYTTPLGSPPPGDAVCWWGDAEFFTHLVGLFALPHFTAHIRFGSQSIVEPDRKRMALKLENSIRYEFARAQ